MELPIGNIEFERLIESSQDCIKVLDLEGRLLSMNTSAMRILEICDPDQLLGSSWIDFWHGKDREAARAAVENARQGRTGRFVGLYTTGQTRKPMWWDVVINAIAGPDGRPEKLLAVSRDVTEWKHSEEIVSAITAGTSIVTGHEFFRSLVKHVTRALKVRYAFVAECLPNLRARSRAFWNGDDFGEDFEYSLAGTPCMEVVQGRTCHVPDHLPQLYPENKSIIDMGTMSYLGVPLLNSARRIIGHLVILDTKPMPTNALVLSVMETFAARAGAELERAHAYEQLQSASRELKTLLEVNVAVGRHLERQELFNALTSCLQNLLETDRFSLELLIEGDRLQRYVGTPQGLKADQIQKTLLHYQGTACYWAIQNRQWVVVSCRDELSERFPVTFDSMKQESLESMCALPLIVGERCLGALYFMASRKNAYDCFRKGFFDQVANAVAVALDNCLAHEEVRRLRDRLAAENVYLQEEIRVEHNFTEIVGNSRALSLVLKQIERIAPTDSAVLILGETGTGKELIARAIHDRSLRKSHPLVKVNCAAISSGLIESELFGHVRGAFTGAFSSREGRFKLADGGTIFLDEVGELTLEMQGKLLRVLQEREFEPVGSSKTLRVDVRVIAATNRDLAGEVRTGKFRLDLFYRLNVLPLTIPPLRDRKEDIPLLALFFLEKFSKTIGKRIVKVSEDSMARLKAYDWPGNIRELQNILERAVVLSTGNVLRIDENLFAVTTANLPGPAPSAYKLPTVRANPIETTLPMETGSLEDVERRHIEAILARTNGLIEGERGAAKILNLRPSTLRSRMQRLGIRRSDVIRNPDAVAQNSE